jgi:hypothetical protein
MIVSFFNFSRWMYYVIYITLQQFCLMLLENTPDPHLRWLQFKLLFEG